MSYGGFTTHIKAEFYHARMGNKSFVDRQLYDQIIHGFRLVDLPHQVYIPPHLMGLAQAFKSVQSEIRRYQPLGYAALYRDVPFHPMRAMCCGATPRKYSDKWRRTNDFTNPYEEFCDADGVPLMSINEIAGRPRLIDGVEYTNPKELKPGFRAAMRDLLILLHYAALTGQTVYLMTDDFKDYFNQHKLRPSEYWKSVMITLAEPGVIESTGFGLALLPYHVHGVVDGSVVGA